MHTSNYIQCTRCGEIVARNWYGDSTIYYECVCKMLGEFLEQQKDLDSEIVDVVSDNLFDLVGG